MGERIVGRLIILLGILFLSSCVLAEVHVISNSENWRDVYSSMLFASLNGDSGDFLASTQHGPVLLNGIPKNNDIVLLNSNDKPFVFNYGSMIEARDYASVEERSYDDFNLELVDELDVNNFIIVDGSYGYSAMAVTPYAVLTDAWVFFADRVNIAEVEAILARKDVNSIVVYGYVDREVNDALVAYNPKVINSGDRFQDNVLIVEEYKKLSDAKQVLLSNGEFIERELMMGAHPILFTGRENVPDGIADYLQRSDIEVGVLIGNELINAATNIRRSAGISVMVKFAQGARSQTAGVSAVEGLDLFYLPTPSLNLEINSVKYNRAAKQVEVTYHSTANVPIYVKGTLTLLGDDGTKKVGDLDSVFIAPSDFKTLIYPDVELTGNDLKAEVYALFGEVKSSLDRELRGSYDMGVINVLDDCEVEITGVKYNKQKNMFIVGIDNVGDVGCYVDVELNDVVVNRVKQTIGGEGSVFVKGGKSGKIELTQRMDDADLIDNPYVNLVAYYGEREESLVGVFRGKFELDVDMFSGTTYLIVVCLILLLLLLIVLWRKKQDNEW
ncbi:hypothetical protein J4226_05855 [Candidatus Pacearchaeota archaeon]|nr:hypothetical protein [Candidatus Pacearchaeota archaeon]